MGDVPVHIGEGVGLADDALEDARRDEDNTGINGLEDLLKAGHVEGFAIQITSHPKALKQQEALAAHESINQSNHCVRR
jgi:hypothetical protein